MSETMYGVLVFHSETGTEGGHYAFQDRQFMGIPDDTQNCSTCGVMREYFEASGNPTPYRGQSRSYCTTHNWTLLHPTGSWSYEGLHVLRSGDELTISDPSTGETAFSGVIDLEPQPLFSHSVHGFWVNDTQRGVPELIWARMFLDSYPASLTPQKR